MEHVLNHNLSFYLKIKIKRNLGGLNFAGMKFCSYEFSLNLTIKLQE